MKPRFAPALLPAALAILPLALLASDKLHLTSSTPASPITVDGHQEDWTGDLTPMGTDPFSVQVANDQDNLYLRVTASDPGVRNEIVRRGLIVWFDDSGGTKKHLGIHYPVVESLSSDDPNGGRSHGGYGGGHRGGSGSGGTSGSGGSAPSDSYEPANRIDILGPGKNDARSLTSDHASGVEAALRVSEGQVFYELKVPLAKTTPIIPTPSRRPPGKRSGSDSRHRRSNSQPPKGAPAAVAVVTVTAVAAGWAVAGVAEECTAAAAGGTPAAVRAAAADTSRRNRSRRGRP